MQIILKKTYCSSVRTIKVHQVNDYIWHEAINHLCTALNTKCFRTFKLNFKLNLSIKLVSHTSTNEISMYVPHFCNLFGCFIYPVYDLLILHIMKKSETGHTCPLCIATRHRILTPTFFFHIWEGCFRFMLDDNLSYK